MCPNNEEFELQRCRNIAPAWNSLIFWNNKKSQTSEHAEFYLTLTLESWWMSGLLSGETESKYFTCSSTSEGTLPRDGEVWLIWKS